jgi:hypothetical protein
MRLNPISVEVRRTPHPPEELPVQILSPSEKKEVLDRKWQTDSLLQHEGKPYTVTIAPQGSGKTRKLKKQLLQRLLANPEKKVLILVPKNDIGEGFTNTKKSQVFTIGEDKVIWDPPHSHDYCGRVSSNKIQSLRNWARDPVVSKLLGDRIAVASHAAMCRLSFSQEEEEKFYKNLILCVDESHHLSEDTELGKIVFLVAYNKAELHLSTATDFRHDEKPTIPVEILPSFNFYHFDLCDALEVNGIRRVGVQCVTFMSNPVPLILAEIMKEPNEFHLVVLPHFRKVSRGKSWRRGTKERCESLKELTDGLQKHFPGQWLEFVTNSGRKEKWGELRSNPTHFHIVVVVDLLREGSDWEPCSRIQHAVPEESMTLASQTAGRTYRAFTGKDNIKLVYYWPEIKPDKSRPIKKCLEDWCCQLFLSMQCLDAGRPSIQKVSLKKQKEIFLNYEMTPNKNVDIAKAIVAQVLGPAATQEQFAFMEQKLTEAAMLQRGFDADVIVKQDVSSYSGFKLMEEKDLFDQSIFLNDFSLADIRKLRLEFSQDIWNQRFLDYKMNPSISRTQSFAIEQRQAKKAGTLDPVHEAQLNSIIFDFDPPEVVYERPFIRRPFVYK